VTGDGAPPHLQLGRRFRARSRRGSEVVATFIGRGADESGMFVRLEDGRIARLDPRRMDWSTFEALAAQGPALRAGDQVVVEAGALARRGLLAEPVGADVVVQGTDGLVRVPARDVTGLFLLYRASDLQPGDRAILRSRSGNTYQGILQPEVEPDMLRLDVVGGKRVELRRGRLDMDAALVAIPVRLD
jgi:hypothetical protein